MTTYQSSVIIFREEYLLSKIILEFFNENGFCLILLRTFQFGKGVLFARNWWGISNKVV